MKKTDVKKDNFAKQIATGLTLSFERLVEVKRKSNADLAFSKNGKIIKVKARDIIIK